MAEVASTPDSTGGVLRQDILLTTKPYAPLVRPYLVARPRLVELIARGLSSCLTLISAPAGSGKTTLLAEWIAARKPSVAWLSLDKGDNDPAPFWVYVILALQGIHDELGESAPRNRTPWRLSRLSWSMKSPAFRSQAIRSCSCLMITTWLKTRGFMSRSLSCSTTCPHNYAWSSPLRFENELAHITLARVYIAQKKLDESTGLLDRLEANAQSGGRTGRLIKILILKALAMQKLGEPAQALAILAKSLALAEPEGYIRVFVDEGSPMQMLLAQWLAHAGANSLRD